MNASLFVVISDAAFATLKAADDLLTPPQIEGSVSMGGNTYYITGNLTPPGGTTYIARLNANGTFIVSQSKQPALTVVHTFNGWTIPA